MDVTNNAEQARPVLKPNQNDSVKVAGSSASWRFCPALSSWLHVVCLVEKWQELQQISLWQPPFGSCLALLIATRYQAELNSPHRSMAFTTILVPVIGRWCCISRLFIPKHHCSPSQQTSWLGKQFTFSIWYMYIWLENGILQCLQFCGYCCIFKCWTTIYTKIFASMVDFSKLMKFN